MAAETPEVLRLAEAVSDREPVDWEGELRAAQTPTRIIEGLRLIERMAEAHERAAGATLETAETLAAEPAQPAKTIARWGRLELREKLGEGSFGEVYRAYDPTLEAEVALKLLKASPSGDARAEERFLGEARTLAQVRHPNVLVVHGADRHDGRIGLWTDLVQGETLEALLEARGRFGAREAALVGIELCHALAAVHARNLVHRDVKTSNVMREQGGRILLMDFGTAARSTPNPARDSGLYGTPLTMAPEQLRGGAIGPAADLYAVGVLLYRLVTNAFPVEAKSLAELAARHAGAERVPLRDRRPDLPAEFVSVVERCLEVAPERRFASAGALERALAASVGAPASPAPDAPVASPRQLFLAAIAVAVAALVAWIVIPRPPVPARHASAETVPAPPTSALTASAVLMRVHAGERDVLPPGAPVAPGARLALQFQCPESAYVYVLDEDDEGRSYVLFPIPGLDVANPLAPGEPHVLPGRLGGKPMSWQVSSTGGTEHILTVAARRPLAELERQLSALPAVRPGKPFAYPRVGEKALVEMRGIGQLAAEPDSGGSHTIARITDALAGLQQATSVGSGVWVWQTTLQNPRRR